MYQTSEKSLEKWSNLIIQLLSIIYIIFLNHSDAQNKIVYITILTLKKIYIYIYILVSNSVIVISYNDVLADC